MISVASRRRRRAVILLGGGAATFVVAALAWVSAQAWQAKDELAAVLPLADELATAVSAQDAEAARDIADRFRTHSDRARDLTASPLWSLAELTPGAGPNLAAVRTVSAQLALVADGAVVPLVEAAAELSGTAELTGIAQWGRPLADAASAWASAREAVGALDTAALLPPVADGVTRLQAVLDAGAPFLEGLSQAGTVLPGLLGAEGPRDILLLVQNPAEVRTGGGITGGFVQLHAEEGEISLVRQADSAVFPASGAPVAPVPEATTALYGDVVGRFVQNATMTSDFALSAQLASAWWQSAYGVVPDAVIAIDPVVLQALLRATGPVGMPDGTSLSADDLVPRLLVDPYLYLDPDAQTAYQQEVSSAVLTALLAQIDPARWAAALAPALAEGRVSAWSAVPAEQEVLAASLVGGPRARHDAAGPGAYAVYLNDVTGGKMGTYLDLSIEAGVDTCASVPEAVVRVTLGNAARAEGIAELPQNMTGGGLFGTAVGDIGTSVTVVAPPDAAFGGVTDDQGPVPSADVIDDGRPSTAVRVNVSPGEEETVEFRFLLPPGTADPPAVVHSPLLRAVPVSLVAPACAR